MKKTLIVLAALVLSACGAVTGGLESIPPSPSAVADRTKLDEQAGITVTIAYTATSKAAGLVITSAAAVGRPLPAATVRRIGELDKAAFDAVTAVRQAYLAANNASYLAAMVQANAAIRALLNAASAARTSEASTAPPLAFNAVYYDAPSAHSLDRAFALAVATRSEQSWR